MGEKMEPYLLRLPPELRVRVQNAAIDERRSVNSQIIVLIERALAAREAR